MQDKTPTSEINFNEFSVATYAEWRDAAIAALKGADFERSMFTKLVDGITLNPIYNQSDVQFSESLPGQYPYRRGTSTLGYTETPWLIAQSIQASSPADFNEKVLYDLQRGLNAVNILTNCRGGLKLRKQADWATALKDVALDCVPVFMTPGSCGLAPFAMYVNEYTSRGFDMTKMTGGILYDPIAKAVNKGSLCGGKGLCAYYDQMAAMTKYAIANAPQMQTIGVSGLPYHDAGASVGEEISTMLATAVAYLRAMEERGISVDEVAPRMRFTVGVGSNLFLEVAKIRALRQLWAAVVTACGGSEASAKIKLHARTSGWTLTKVDPWVNMLRGTAQAFSAVLGGVDSLDVLPFDLAAEMPDEFARRIARNVQLILQGECNLDRVVDPAGGSWYIENLTDTVAHQAWEMFQEIEKANGIAKALQAGTIQAKINTTAQKRYELIDQRRETLVGINKYVNLDEKPLPNATQAEATTCGCTHKHSGEAQPLPQVSIDVDSVRQVASAGEVGCCLLNKALTAQLECKCGEAFTPEALPIRRASERFEGLLAKSAAVQLATGQRPQVFFANMGPLRQHKARADFSQDFLRAGGIDAIYSDGFNSAEDAAKAAVDNKCKVCVICSTDDTYPDIVPAFCQTVKSLAPDMTIVLAGYPTDHVESFKSAGVDIFLHIRANCFDVLETIQSKLGL